MKKARKENYQKVNEVWKDIIRYEGFYQVSNMGRVRSLDRDIIDKNGIVYSLKGSMREISSSSKGYQDIGLSKDGQQKTFMCISRDSK